MPLSAVEIIKLAVGVVPNYNGSPENLQKFLDSVDLLASLADGNDVLAFVKTRLEQKARNVSTIDELKSAIKANIKPVDSEVIRARISALKVDGMQLSEFIEKAEELADQFQHALILETGNSESARKQTQKELVKLCRANARNDLTRSVIASSNYYSPKEVLAKFVTEIADEKTEKSVLHMKRRFNRNRDVDKNFQYRSNYANRSFQRNANRNNHNYRRGTNRNFNQPLNKFRQNNRHIQNNVRYVNSYVPGNGENPRFPQLGDINEDN